MGIQPGAASCSGLHLVGRSGAKDSVPLSSREDGHSRKEQHKRASDCWLETLDTRDTGTWVRAGISSDLTSSFPGQLLRNPLAQGHRRTCTRCSRKQCLHEWKTGTRYPRAGKGGSVMLDSPESAACECLGGKRCRACGCGQVTETASIDGAAAKPIST